MGKVTSFLFGGVVGVVVGVLVAPRSGEETRALVADKVDEYWGKGQEFYTKGVARVQTGVAGIQPAVTQRGDELREKIETARNLIADQVAKNAATARDVLNDKLPIAAEKVEAAAGTVRNQLENAATALKNRVTELSDESVDGESIKAADAAKLSETADVAETAEAIDTEAVDNADTNVNGGFAGSTDQAAAPA